MLLTFSASPALLQLFTGIGRVGTGNHARLHFFNWFVRVVVPGVRSGASRSSIRQSEAGVVTTAALRFSLGESENGFLPCLASLV